MENYKSNNSNYINAMEQVCIDNPALYAKLPANLKKDVKSFMPSLKGWTLDETVLTQTS